MYTLDICLYQCWEGGIFYNLERYNKMLLAWNRHNVFPVNVFVSDWYHNKNSCLLKNLYLFPTMCHTQGLRLVSTNQVILNYVLDSLFTDRISSRAFLLSQFGVCRWPLCPFDSSYFRMTTTSSERLLLTWFMGGYFNSLHNLSVTVTDI